ncbi:hypothetical protein V6Z12_A04G116600 [Gossypium hirsutum]
MVLAETESAEYEVLPLICYKCGCYGHILETCPLKVKETEMARGTATVSQPSSPSG